MLRRLGAAVGAVVLVLGIGACGDDDDGDTSAAEQGEGVEAEGDDQNPCAEGGEGGDAGGAIREQEPTAPEEGATEVEITGTDYAFEGFDAITSTGEYAITFRNEGDELHEMNLVRLTDEETPLEEILSSEEEPDLTEIAFSFACPGSAAETTAASIDEPGRYAAVCFMPVGATPETPPEEFETLGPPHAVRGMVAEIRVES